MKVKTKSQIFYHILKQLTPDNTEFKKIKNGYKTFLPLSKIGSELIYDVKLDILRVTKLVKILRGGVYEPSTEDKSYKVKKTDRGVTLHPLT